MSPLHDVQCWPYDQPADSPPRNDLENTPRSTPCSCWSQSANIISGTEYFLVEWYGVRTSRSSNTTSNVLLAMCCCWSLSCQSVLVHQRLNYQHRLELHSRQLYPMKHFHTTPTLISHHIISLTLDGRTV